MGRKPNKGLYAIRNRNSPDYRYVGKSEDIDRRLEEHRRSGLYHPGIDEVVRLRARDSTRRDNLEARLIRSLEPTENQRSERVHGGLLERFASWREGRRLTRELRGDK